MRARSAQGTADGARRRAGLIRTDRSASYPDPDGKLTFDKLSSVFLSGNKTRDDAPSHIRVARRVPREVGELWVNMCPAHVYELGREDAGKVEVSSLHRTASSAAPSPRRAGGCYRPRAARARSTRSRERVTVSREDVLAAREAIGGRLHRTPLFSSRSLSERIGADAHLKAELFQRTGSFKPRGMLAKLASLSAEEKSRGIVTWSAGNAAQGAAYAAALDGTACRVFMWRNANPRKVEAARAYGAEVDLEAEGPAEAHERLLAFAEETGRTFVHPFDDPVLQAGHGSLGLEVEEDLPGVDTIVAPIGGGGLISGIASAVGCRVIGVEPESAATLTAALAAGEPVRIEPSSVADGLNAPFTGEHTLGVVRDRVDEIVLVTEERDRRWDALSLRPRQARLRAVRCRCDGCPARRQDRLSSPVRRWSPSCREATRTRRSLLLSSPRPDED